jgi:hypothetical protein
VGVVALIFSNPTQIVTKNTYKKNSQYLLKIAFINEKNSLGISDDSIIAKQKARGSVKDYKCITKKSEEK